MGNLQDKTAVITGASRGIGRAIALALAGAGAGVYLVADGTRGELESAAAACREAGAPRAEIGVFDLAEQTAAQRVIDAALAALERIDVLVNNAGIRVRKPFGAFTAGDFELGMAVNLRAPFMLSQAVLPVMRGQGGGRIIHIASQLGSVATPGSALYGLSKAALIHLTRSMALELGREGIMVNAVSPGPTETEYMRARWQQEPGIREQRLAEIPLGRYGHPQEIAQAVLFLATADAGFIQGHDLVIDGGYTIR